MNGSSEIREKHLAMINNVLASVEAANELKDGPLPGAIDSLFTVTIDITDELYVSMMSEVFGKYKNKNTINTNRASNTLSTLNKQLKSIKNNENTINMSTRGTVVEALFAGIDKFASNLVTDAEEIQRKKEALESGKAKLSSAMTKLKAVAALASTANNAESARKAHSNVTSYNEVLKSVVNALSKAVNANPRTVEAAAPAANATPPAAEPASNATPPASNATPPASAAAAVTSAVSASASRGKASLERRLAARREAKAQAAEPASNATPPASNATPPAAEPAAAAAASNANKNNITPILTELNTAKPEQIEGLTTQLRNKVKDKFNINGKKSFSSKKNQLGKNANKIGKFLGYN